MEGLLLKVYSLYCWSHSLVRIASSKLDPFPIRIGLCQGCPLSSVLFRIFMDRICRCSQAAEGFKFGGLWIPSLVFTDDMVMLTSLNSYLQLALGWFATECEAAGMRIITSKFEAMVLSWKRGGLPTPSQWRVTSPSGRVEVSWGLVHI